jgi:hypothetical protein
MKHSIDLNKLEILKMARELTINEYIDKRAQEHNEWLDKSTELWKTQRIALAYPVIPPYPTEKEIINRAKILMEFLFSDDNLQPENKDEIRNNEFNDEAEYSNLTQVIEEELGMPSKPEETQSTKMPSIMKGIQDIKEFINDRK